MRRMWGLLAVFLLAASAPAAADVVIDATNFPDETFRDYVRYFDRPDEDEKTDGVLSAEEIAGVTIIQIPSKAIRNLKGIEHFTALKQLDCRYNQLTSLDVSKNTALESLMCEENQLTELDVSKNTALESLWCEENQLTELNASGCTALVGLHCYKNKLIFLDVSGCAALRVLDFFENQLISLDVSGCAALKWLYCDKNKLIFLDVSGCAALEDLLCFENQLISLDVSGCVALKDLACYDNQLTALDVSNNTALEDLICWGNQLVSLDVSGCAALKNLGCEDNQLISLDVSRNKELKDLSCGYNQLTELDVTRCAALKDLACGDNRLAALDVSQNTALESLWCKNNRLTALDVSKNRKLGTLRCEENRLTFLDLQGLDRLINPASVDVGGQTRDGLRVSETGGAYVVDLGAFLSADRFVNVKDLSGKAGSADLTARYNFGSGKAAFDAKPEKVTYRYDTGKAAYPMEVSLVEAIKPPISPDVPVPNYRITVFPSYHGRITLQNATEALSGDVIVSAGSTATFVVSADAGYEIAYLRDNAVSVSVPAGAARYEHTIPNVWTAHRLEAAFKAKSTPPVNPPAPPSGPDVPPVTPPVNPPASPDVPPVPPVTPPVSPDIPAPSPSGPADIPSSANQWTIHWGERDAQGNVSVTVDVRIESESPLIAGSIRLEVSGIGKVRIVLLLNGQEVSGVPARAAAQKRAYTLRVMGTVPESARDTARIDAVRYKLEGSDEERTARLGTDGGGILLKDMTQKPETPEPGSGGGCDVGVSGIMLALVGAFLLRRKA